MTKKQELKWRKFSREYSDKYFGTFRVRQILKKRRVSLPLDVKQELLDDYGTWVSQLESTHTRLKRFPVFLSSSHLALEKKGISNVSQFIYHVENYLALIYIFDQRVKRLVRFIEKLAIRNQCPEKEIQDLIDAKENFISSIEPLVLIRNGHTHEKYFYDKDFEEMERYDKAGDFSSIPYEKKIFKTLAKNRLNIQRKKWKKDINDDIDECEIHIGILYTTLDKLLWKIHKKI